MTVLFVNKLVKSPDRRQRRFRSGCIHNDVRIQAFHKLCGCLRVTEYKQVVQLCCPADQVLRKFSKSFFVRNF